MASNTKLYVGNLSPKCTYREIRDLFSKFGKIVECKMMNGYAFVHFAESKNAKVAITQTNNTKWNGTILSVQPSYGNTKLFVGNLPKICSEGSVQDLFSKIGKVAACNIVKDFAFVHFTNCSDAFKAVEKLNDKEWKGSILRVEPSHSEVHLKPGIVNRGECFRCGKTGHLCRKCPIVSKGSNIQKKTSTPLHNHSKESSAMNGNVGGVYSFVSNYSSPSKYRDNDEDFLAHSHRQTFNSKYWLHNEYNGVQNSRNYHSNSYDYDRDVYTSSIRRSPYSDDYPPPSTVPSHYRHQPYPTANERRFASSSMSDSHRLLSLSSSYSLSPSHPGSNSNIRDINRFFRPPPEYYEHRRRRTFDNSPFAPSREHYH